MIRRLLVIVSFMTLGAFGSLQAQTNDQQHGTQGSGMGQQGTQDQQVGQNAQGSLSDQDQDFVKKAAQSNMAEIQLGQLAAQKASNDAVKQYAQQLVNDHQKAEDKLQQIASSKGITLQTDMDGQARSEQDRLSNMSGKDFDREFVQQQKKDHDQAVALFQGEADNGKDPDLKSYASSIVAVLQQHEQMASSLELQVGGSPSASDQGGRGKYGPENQNGPGTTSSYPSSTTNPDVNNTNPSSSSSSASTTTQPNSTTNPNSATSPDMTNQNTQPGSQGQGRSSTSSSSSTTTTDQSTAAQSGVNDQGQALPRTASNLPLVGLAGLLLLGAGLVMKSFRFLRNNS